MKTTALGQAVENAYQAELAAERFYRELAENTQDSKARNFLFELAKQEREHANAFKRFGERLEAGELPFAADFNVELVETAPEWAFAQELTYEQALEIALENEQRAELYYETLAECTDDTVAEFFKRIAKTEQQHVRVLQETRDAEIAA